MKDTYSIELHVVLDFFSIYGSYIDITLYDPALNEFVHPLCNFLMRKSGHNGLIKTCTYVGPYEYVKMDPEWMELMRSEMYKVI